MFLVTGSQFLDLHEGASIGLKQRLPWVNGSLLPARLNPTDTAGIACLLLGNFRLRAKVPLSTPMGNVWLQLIHREMPAQFRLLSDTQAEIMLVQMLHKFTPDQAKIPTSNKSREHNWTKLDTDFLPFTADAMEDGKNLILRNEEDGTPLVILNQSSYGDHFYIQGRLDLERMGPLVFTLEGGDKRNWRLHMFVDNPSALSHLRTFFDPWLSNRRMEYISLEGDLFPGLPDNLSALAGDIQA